MYRLPLITLISVLLFTACSNRKNAAEEERDNTQLETSLSLPGDTSLEAASQQILSLLKAGHYDSLALYIHPEKGIRFAPYAFIDTTIYKVFTRDAFTEALASEEILHWGTFDGSGAAIDMDIPSYFKRFVYDADYLNAEHSSLNQSLAVGNSIQNLEEIYPGLPYTESYFSGFEPEYAGMDWRALSLVFEQVSGHYRLVAIVHNEWTI